MTATNTLSLEQNHLPTSGFVRLKQIVGDPREGIPPIIPVSKSTWWAGCKSGIFPAPVKLGPRVTVWRVADIRALIESRTVKQHG